MTITEIRIKLPPRAVPGLLAFCTITLDDELVVRDLRLIRGRAGAFVAMPSRLTTDLCGRCRAKTPLAARYCHRCGFRLDDARPAVPQKAEMFADVVHPATPAFRDRIEAEVLRAYQAEVELAARPGYVCGYERAARGRRPAA